VSVKIPLLSHCLNLREHWKAVVWISWCKWLWMSLWTRPLILNTLNHDQLLVDIARTDIIGGKGGQGSFLWHCLSAVLFMAFVLLQDLHWRCLQCEHAPNAVVRVCQYWQTLQLTRFAKLLKIKEFPRCSHGRREVSCIRLGGSWKMAYRALCLAPMSIPSAWLRKVKHELGKTEPFKCRVHRGSSMALAFLNLDSLREILQCLFFFYINTWIFKLSLSCFVFFSGGG